MIKFVNSLLLALLIAGSSSSQTIYLPGNSVVFRDTSVVITVAQMDAINDIFITVDQLYTTIDTLNINLQSVYRLSRIADSTSQQQILIANSRILERDQLLSTYNSLDKQQKKQIRKLRATKTVLGISTGVLGGAVIVLMILL